MQWACLWPSSQPGQLTAKDTGLNVCSHNVARHVEVDADEFALWMKRRFNWAVLSGSARFSIISQYLACSIRCVHHPPWNNMLDFLLLGWPVEQPERKWPSLIFPLNRFPPHFVQALRGKGVLPTGPGFGSRGWTISLFHFDFHKVSEGTGLDLWNALC